MISKNESTVYIFTDGSCLNNPGPGGWGALLRYNSHEKELSGSEAATTNNRMELTAAIKALSALQKSCNVVLCTDSQYLKKGITIWIDQWKKRGWKTQSKRPVKNTDLWKQLDKIVQKHKIKWEWVRAHCGHPENERVDTLARSAIKFTKH